MNQTFIYFLTTESADLVKFGISASPGSRLHEISKWSPVPIVLMGHVPGTHHDEKALHSRYMAHHSHFEWFHASPEMLADVQRILRAGEIPEEWRGKPGQKNPLISTRARRAAALRLIVRPPTGPVQ